MSQKTRKSTKAPKVVATVTTPAPVETAPVEAAPPVPAATPTRLPRAEAKQINFARTLGSDPAPVVLTAKGTNPTRTRVYGYANGLNGGRVPLQAAVQVAPGFTGCPKGVAPAQWAALQAAANGVTPVANLYANGVSSRTVRRAFRAGAITFVNVG
jgi:hypothetical protein